MTANGAANLLQFRLVRLDLAFLFLLPYWLPLGAFLGVVYPLDRRTFTLFLIYAAYQLFAAVWSYEL
jgi:hypothetical protein